MQDLHLDFETRSAIDLTAVGSYTYAQHETTGVWCMGYAFDDEPAGVLNVAHGHIHEAQDWQRIQAHVADGLLVYAHNAAFEFDLWNLCMARLYMYGALPLLKPEQMRCTQAMALAAGLPAKLVNVAEVTGAAVQKDMAGHALMMRMCRPWKFKANGQPIWMDENPKFRAGGVNYAGMSAINRLMEYCREDVDTERAIIPKMLPLSPAEQEVFTMNMEINERGIHVDVEGAKSFHNLITESSSIYNTKIAEVTDNAVTAVTQIAGIKSWCAEHGVPIASIAKDEIVELLKLELPDDVYKVLTLRQEAGKSSTAKIEKMLGAVADDECLHGMLQYHGAGATGRFTGQLVQLHNLPRGTPPPSEVDDILTVAHEPALVDMMYGSPFTLVSKCIRGLLAPKPGKVFVSGDFASVEGCGTAWHVGEEWKLKAYRAAQAGTGPGLYELAYARMFGIAITDVTEHQRQVGKVTELAFGFGGGVGAFHSMAKNYGVHVSDEDADAFKIAWRLQHPKTVRGWGDLESAAIAAVWNPGKQFHAGADGRQVTFVYKKPNLYCRLPSGRIITYPLPAVRPGMYGPELTHFRTLSGDEKRRAKVVDDPRNRPFFSRISTWGGTLMENIVQALCRDLLVDVMLQLRALGIPIVLHVHDEIVVEVYEENAEATCRKMQQLMCAPPAWAKDFPLHAKCKITTRYGK